MRNLIRKLLKEQAHINKHGGLKDFSFGVKYPFDEIKTMVQWFSDENGEQMYDEGWEIIHSKDDDYPKQKYDSPKGFWRIAMADEGSVVSEMEADVKAKGLGLLVDDYGIVVGYKEHNLIDDFNG
jgi:hypothetical protein